jgi:hypothetical protein
VSECVGCTPAWSEQTPLRSSDLGRGPGDQQSQSPSDLHTAVAIRIARGFRIISAAAVLAGLPSFELQALRCRKIISALGVC